MFININLMVFNLYLLHLDGNIHNENALITIDGNTQNPDLKDA